MPSSDPERAAQDQVLLFAGTKVPPATERHFEVPVSALPTGHDLSLPVRVLNGALPGPRLWLSAALHGDELNGVEIVRGVLDVVRPQALRGALYAVPIVNVFGFLQHSRYLPDRRDLNRSFPGSQRGSLAGRLASLFLDQIVAPCDYGIDLHTAAAGRTNLPQIRADLEDEATRTIALAFGAPVAIHSKTRDGSLREIARRRGVPVLLYEGGESLRFDDWAIESGVNGVLAVLHSLGMLEGDPPAPPVARPTVCQRTTWVRAGGAGMFRTAVALGERVERGAELGFVADPLGRRRVALRAPHAGLVIGHVTNPLVYRGDALVHLTGD